MLGAMILGYLAIAVFVILIVVGIAVSIRLLRGGHKKTADFTPSRLRRGIGLIVASVTLLVTLQFIYLMLSVFVFETDISQLDFSITMEPPP